MSTDEQKVLGTQHGIKSPTQTQLSPLIYKHTLVLHPVKTRTRMKVFVCLLLGISCLDLNQARPSEKVKEIFNLNVLEKKTEFQQEVTLDDEEHIVAVHVPAHNDVDETYFITDTAKHLTMRVAPQQKMSFLTEHDPEELPSADVWRKTKTMAQNELIKDTEFKKKKMSYMITGTLHSKERKTLGRKMNDMCDDFPIAKMEPMYQTLQESGAVDEIENRTYINYTDIEPKQANRFKRQIDDNIFIDECAPGQIRQICVIFTNSCYYIMQCDTAEDPQGREAATCFKRDHLYDDVRCCMPCCLHKVDEGNPSPYCKDNRITKEDICPNYNFAPEEAAGDDPGAGPETLSKTAE